MEFVVDCFGDLDTLAHLSSVKFEEMSAEIGRPSELVRTNVASIGLDARVLFLVPILGRQIIEAESTNGAIESLRM